MAEAIALKIVGGEALAKSNQLARTNRADTDYQISPDVSVYLTEFWQTRFVCLLGGVGTMTYSEVNGYKLDSDARPLNSTSSVTVCVYFTTASGESFTIPNDRNYVISFGVSGMEDLDVFNEHFDARTAGDTSATISAGTYSEWRFY